MLKVSVMANSMFGEAAFPGWSSAFQLVRETSFHELDCLFQGGFWAGGEDDVDMVWHDDPGVESVASACPVGGEDVDKKRPILLDLKDGSASGGYEECAQFLRRVPGDRVCWQYRTRA
jgi:hypothetical protein